MAKFLDQEGLRILWEQIKARQEEALENLAQTALHFAGVVEDLNDIEDPKDGYIALIGTSEYVYSDGDWHLIGDEGAYQTKAEAEVAKEELLNAIEESAATYSDVGYTQTDFEVMSAVSGFLTDNSQNDLRVYIPENAEFYDQNVGAGGNVNRFYMTVRAWAPRNDVTACRKGSPDNYENDFKDMEVVHKDTKSGRMYADFWMPIAAKNDDGTWTNYVTLCTDEKYVGWNYLIEWYVGDEKVAIGTKRINLSTLKGLYDKHDWDFKQTITKLEEKINKAEPDVLTKQDILDICI